MVGLMVRNTQAVGQPLFGPHSPRRSDLIRGDWQKVTGQINFRFAIKTYAFTMDLEQLAPLRPFAFALGILVLVSLFKYLQSHPKFSQSKSVQTMAKLENPSKQDKIYILKVVIGISAAILIPLITIIVFFEG